EWLRPCVTKLSGRRAAFRRNVFRLTGENVATRDRATEQNFGMQRIGRGVARFAARAQTFPIAIGDLGMIAARRSADGAAVLLRAGDPVRKAIVRCDVIDLRCRLVVPGTPRYRAIDSDNGALVAGDNHSLRIVRIDPELVIIVAAG